jgi:RNA-directed DNA polymerase
LLSNVALSVLDEHIAQIPGGSRSTPVERAKRQRHGLANYRLIRYADLCRARHKSAYAEVRVMPTRLPAALGGKRFAVSGSA